MRTRIVEYVSGDGEVRYRVEQKHFLFRWWWVPAWINHNTFMQDDFDSLDDAEKLYYKLTQKALVGRIVRDSAWYGI